mmetsp:Transcript_1410/g.2299  ORF Transcript_1410/g.2299 Transcript_1410/m.2299 type:complete len:948 (-) Transcript_1410:20-2863(-)
MYDEDDKGFKVQEFVAHSTKANCLCFGPKSNQVLATGGEDYKVNIWRVGNVSNIWTLGQNKSPIESLCFDSDEQCIVSGAMNGSLKVFDLNEGRLVRNLGSHPVNVRSLQYHPYGEFIVSGSVDCTMKVWDVRNKSCIQTYNGHTKEVTCVRFSPDGKWVASSSKDGQILLWDLVAGKLINSIKLQPTYVRKFEFNPSEFTLAAATSMRTVKFWDLETMQPMFNTTPESNQIQALSFSTLGTAICTAAKDSLKVWDLDPNLHMNMAIDTGWDKIEDMRISNNFQLVAGSCISNFVSVWTVDLEEFLSSPYDDDESWDAPSEDNITASADAVDRGGGRGGEEDSTADAKHSGNEIAPVAVDNNLDKVREQLAKLSSDLGLPPSASTCNGDGVAASAGNRASVAADSKGEEDLSGRYRHQHHQHQHLQYPSGASQRLRSDSKTSTGYDMDSNDGDDSDSYKSERAGSSTARGGGGSSVADSGAKTALSDIPEVVWDSGELSKEEMATSMGESFWKRFKESSQQQHRDLEAIVSGGGGAAAAADVRAGKGSQSHTTYGIEDHEEAIEEQLLVNPQGSGEDAKEEIPGVPSPAQMSVHEELGMSDAELAQMLPGPSYGAAAAGAGGSSAHVSSTSPPAAAASKQQQHHQQQRAAAGVRYSPLTQAHASPPPPTAATAAAVDAVPLLPNRKAPTPTFPRYRAPHTPSASSSASASALDNITVAVPNASPPHSLEVVGNRHLRNHVQQQQNDDVQQQRKCDDLLDSLVDDNGPVKSNLAQRLASLRVLRQLWSKGDVLEAIEHLTILSDAVPHNGANLVTLADFFNAIELKGNGLSLDSCMSLLPILEQMLLTSDGWTSEHITFAIFRSLSSLAHSFGELIRSTRSIITAGGPAAGGVDLSREARLNKCNTCHAVFSRTSDCIPMVQRKFKASTTIMDVLDTYSNQCHRYFLV